MPETLFQPTLGAIRALALILLAILCIACGGGGGASSSSGGGGVRVSISPSAPTVAPGATVNFTATVTGTANQSVTWSASPGSIGPNGFYVAPSIPGTYQVTATSVADPAASTTVNVVVQSNNSLTVTVTPPSTTLGYGAQAQFSATVTGSSNQVVTWTASSGTINSTGLFTAPNRTTQVTVQAHSVANPAAGGIAQVTVKNTGAIVQISPLTAKVPQLGTFQFHANVLNISNQNVSWSATGGTIDSTGLFTAGRPTGNFTVTATSVADPTQSATVPVEVNPVNIVINVTNTQVVVGQTVQFSAVVFGIPNQAVTWTASAGTISPQGIFTAPATPQSVTITATSSQNSAYTQTATETVVNETDDFYSFDTGIPSVWSPARAGTTPTAIPFLGVFGQTQAATLSLSALTTHTSLTIKFDVYIVGAWTGISGNSPFTVSVDGTSAFSQTFSNVSGDNQSFPLSSNSPPGSGALATNSLGYTSSPAILFNDAVYAVTLTNLPHTADTVSIVFASNLPGTIGQMSWGLKNVEVIANP